MSNIQITGRHLELTPAIQEYFKTKFERIERHFDHITNVHVVLTLEKTDHIAEATVHGSGGADIFAQTKAENLYASIDLLIDKLDRQVIKHKEKNLRT